MRYEKALLAMMHELLQLRAHVVGPAVSPKMAEMLSARRAGSIN